MWKSLRERRGLRAAALGGLAVVLVLVLALTLVARGPLAGPQSAGSPALASRTPLPSASGTLEPASSASLSPAPYETTKPVSYTPPPPATPTPSPQPGTWRWEGVVVDESNNPVKDVCIAVGPHGCLANSTRTDERGVWFIDFPRAQVDYDLHFIKEGFRTYDVRITPVAANEFDVILAKG